MRVKAIRSGVASEPPPTFVRLWATIERNPDDPAADTFVISMRGKDGGVVETRLLDGERIDFTIYLP